MSEHELKHHGVLGMKWGVRKKRDKSERRTLGRKTSLTETIESKKKKVEAAQKEASERLDFYGGRNVALRKIKEEANYASRVAIGKHSVRAVLGTVGSVGITALAAATIPYGAGLSALCYGLLGAGTVGSVSVSSIMGGRELRSIKKHASEQVDYTKDLLEGRRSKR